MRALNLLVAATAATFISSLAVAETETREYDRKTQENNVLFVIDHSGSVAGATLEGYKAAIAVETAKHREKRFGLIHYPSDNSCGVHYGPELDKGTGADIASMVGGLQGAGASPIAAGFQRAKDVMAQFKECVKLIVFTDFEESCGGDIKGVQAGIDAFCMEINLITHKSEREIGILGELVKKSGGKMHQVNGSRDSVRRAVEDILKKKRTTGSTTTSGTPSEKPKEKPKTKEKPKEEEKPKPYEYGTGTGGERGRGSK